MINGKSVLAIIPARGGSKGVPRKNVKILGGKPLIAWTIEAAGRSKYIDRLILSSDDQEIREIAFSLGCEVPFLRPDELATDASSSMDVVHHAARSLDKKYDYVVLLQPTSPFRQTKDIDECIDLCVKQNAPACVSVTKCAKNPLWMYSIAKNGLMLPVVPTDERPERRQELPPAFELNGAVYVAESNWLDKKNSFVQTETVAHVMPRERSMDIDTERDFLIAQFLIEKDVDYEPSSEKICRLHQERNQTDPEGRRNKDNFKKLAF